MLPLHRLESRRGRKPLVKISFHSYLSLRPCALVNTLKPAGRVVSSHGQWPLMSRQLFSRYPGVNGQGSAYRVNDFAGRMRRVNSSKIDLRCCAKLMIIATVGNVMTDVTMTTERRDPAGFVLFLVARQGRRAGALSQCEDAKV
jgi:hypothetical protein